MELFFHPFFSVRLSFTLFHLFLTIISFSFCSAQPLCRNGERLALLQLKSSFTIDESASTDPSSYDKLASWTTLGGNSGCCSWDGVECNSVTGHVTALNLNSSRLYGSINSTSSLFQLSQLRSLNLADNHFNYSRIPSKLGNLSRLVYLNLSGSFFYGQIPSEISQLFSLSFLDLSFNLDLPSGISLLRLESPNFDNFVRNLSNLKHVNLSHVNISSHVPRVLANFSSLTSLILYSCRLNGEFPDGVFRLPNLKCLDLGMNQGLRGHFPEFQFGRPIEVLRLSETSFSGRIPSSIGKLVFLTRFSLLGSRFLGLLPPSLGNLTRLTVLDLSGNNLTGQIPPQIGNLTELTFLNLESNKFYGSVAESFSRLKNLQLLSVFDNKLGGMLDFNMFLNMTHLTSLQLSYNYFSIHTDNMKNTNTTNAPMFKILEMAFCNLNKFPEFLRNQDRLVYLNLAYNHIYGQIPKWMWNVSSETMESLFLGENFLTGFEQPTSILPWIRLAILHLSHNMLNGPLVVPLPSIRRYVVANNSFSGKISPLFCNLSHLYTLDLSNNKLTGKLPDCFGNLSDSLTVLNLRNNHFHGSIPELCPHKSELQLIDLGDNLFQGNLPRSLVRCITLEILVLENNQLDDVFPHQLGALQELKILILRSNRLHGVIENHVSNLGFPNLRVVDLSHNNFSGLLPSEYFKKWMVMKSIDMGNSSYMRAETNFNTSTTSWEGNYTYSVTVWNKGSLLYYNGIQEVFVAIDFSNNKFEGEIPDCIGDLKRLQVLNLSNNILTGNIPSSFGDVVNLESLDLSENKLSGRIPHELKQLTFLAYFNVSYNRLTGQIPQGNQLDTFGSSSYQGNLGLCGYPLPKKCENSDTSGSTVPLPPQDDEEEDSKSVFASNWMTIVPGFFCGLLVGVAIECSLSSEAQERIAKVLFALVPKQNGRGRRGRMGGRT